MDDERLRLALGIMGNAASLLLYASPILTFRRVIKKKSIEGYSSVPYIVALVTCVIWTWYSLPIVSNHWENFPLLTISSVGTLFQLAFLSIFLFFAASRARVQIMVTMIPLIVLLCVIVVISTLVFHDHCHRKVFVGSIGDVFGVVMYGSPLIAVKTVIRTKSVEFMPFHLSFFSFAASFIWLVYGLLSKDLFLAVPGFVGCPLAILQLVLYFVYNKTRIQEDPGKGGAEQNLEKIKHVELDEKNDNFSDNV